MTDVIQGQAALFAGLLLLVAACACAQEGDSKAPAKIPKVPAGHPRVYVRPSDVDAIRAKTTLEEFQTAWKAIRKSKRPLCKAFIYLVTGDKQIGREAVEGGLANIKKMTPLWNGKLTKDGRPITNHMHKGACIYDWCYDLLTDEEKKTFIEEFKTFAALDHKRGYPPTKRRPNPMVGHDSEGWIMSNLLPAGVAVYDEYPEMYELSARIFLESFVEARNHYYQAHMHHQGHHYSGERFVHDQLTSWLFRRMGAGDVLSREQQYVPYELIYFMRPDQKYFASGDGGDDGGHDSTKRFAALLTGTYYDDPYLMTLADFKQLRVNDFYYVFDLLFLKPNAPRKPFSELPQTKYFGSPMGDMIARTSWQIGPDSRAAAVYMRLGEYYFGNHQHRDFGTFQLFYRGPLAIDTGIYWGSKETCYGSPQWRYYYQHTVSHNGLMIFDPATAEQDYGGQRTKKPRHPNTLEMLKTQDFRWAEVLAHEFGPDTKKPEYSYLAGDITKSYYPSKASKVKRAMVAFDTGDSTYPCVFVVLDQVVSTNPAFKKAWYLHSIQEPKVQGRTATIIRDGKSYHGGEYGGQLVVESLLPEQARIDKVGGPGKECWNEVTGENYQPLTNKRAHYSEIGAWRIEVIPTKPVKADRFLHVLTMMDKGTPKPSVTPITTDQFVGARVVNRAVLLNQTDALLREAAFDVPGDSAIGLLVCGLTPGEWTIEGPAGKQTMRASADGKCLYLKASPGRHRLSRPTKTPQ